MGIIEFIKSLPEATSPVDKLVIMVLVEKPHLKNREICRLLNMSERTVYRVKKSLEVNQVDLKSLKTSKFDLNINSENEFIDKKLNLEQKTELSICRSKLSLIETIVND